MSVSVIIPTRGRKSLINAIDSVLRQTYIEIELIIVDDSPEQNVSMKDMYIARTGGGKGASYARNIGLSLCQGDWIAFLDDDDEWHEDKIKDQLDYSEALTLDVVLTQAKVNGKLRPSKSRYLLHPGKLPSLKLYEKPHLLKSQVFLPTSSYLLRKQFGKHLLFNDSYLDRENIDFLDQCFKNGARISQIPKPLVTINYDKYNSLSRMTLKEELIWWNRLKIDSENSARNFALESSRNFLRIRKFYESGYMLKLSKTANSFPQIRSLILQLLLFVLRKFSS